MLFKTHKALCRNLVQKLISDVLPKVAQREEKAKTKFLLFILDDMIEFLGPEYLGPLYGQIVQQICTYSNNKFAAIRQAAAYGIGMVAEHGGQAFAGVNQLCLQGLNACIEFKMDAKTKAKKSKTVQFHHARDNAVAALGKIIKHQKDLVDINQLMPAWLGQLPLTHDMEEAHIQNKMLAEQALKNPQFILGA
jgi:hypothetical protein